MDLKKILATATALACLTAPALAVDAGGNWWAEHFAPR